MQNFSLVKTALMIFTVFALIQACSQCKDPDPIPTISCGEGYDIVNNECFCPTGNIEAYGNCYTLADNEYFGVSQCYCIDSVFIKIYDPKPNPQTGILESKVDYDIRTNVNRGSDLVYYQEGGIEYWIGPYALDGFTPLCLVEGKLTSQKLWLKRISPDSLHASIIYLYANPDTGIKEPVDTCTLILTR